MSKSGWPEQIKTKRFAPPINQFSISVIQETVWHKNQKNGCKLFMILKGIRGFENKKIDRHMIFFTEIKQRGVHEKSEYVQKLNF